MTTPAIKCAGSQPPQQPPLQAPSGSKVTEQVRQFYREIQELGGVLSDDQALELQLQGTFNEAYAGLLSVDLRKPGRYNKLEGLLASQLGWVRMLWQGLNSGTGAGLVREALLERSHKASGLIGALVRHEALPIIRELQGTAFRLLDPLVGREEAMKLLYDHVVVGQLTLLRNVSDAEPVVELAFKRYTAHYQKLDDLDPSGEAKEALDLLSLKLIETTDAAAKLARDAGVKLNNVRNGGYFPNTLQPEFENFLRAQKTTWLEGFRSLKDGFQKARISNLPVVLNTDELTALLQDKLLRRAEGSPPLSAYATEELRVLEAAAEEARLAADEIRAEYGTNATEAAANLERSLGHAEKLDVSKKRRLLEAKLVGERKKLRVELQTQGYSKAEAKSVFAAQKAADDQTVARQVAEWQATWAERKNAKLDALFRREAAAGEKAVQQFLNSQGKDVRKVLDFEQAKLQLANIASSPGELSRFLHDSFTPRQLQNLFDAGVLDSLPATSDELLEFYRNVDTGVRGLSDALVLDPVAALKSYGESLERAAADASLFKTAFNEGSLAGWVRDDAAPDFIQVGASPLLRKYLEGGDLIEGVGELYIHKNAAEQLDALLALNTNPSNVASAANAWQVVSGVFRRSLIMAGGLGYMKRVFMQNLIANYAATGSVAQLPLALVDTFRAMQGGLGKLQNSKQVFSVAGKNYSARELFSAMVGARGGHGLLSLQDPNEFYQGTVNLFSKDSRQRAQHFNALYRERYGEPLVGGLQNAFTTGGNLFNTAYRGVAFVNQFLDLAFRWSVVRELASTSEFAGKSFDELMKRTDEYFSINANTGTFGQQAGSVLMPFAQFAINAPGAALRHALQHPWRTGNVMTMYAGAQGSDSISESELPEWLKESDAYFFTMWKDPDTGKRHVVMPGGVDFMLDSYNWMLNIGKDLAGVSSSPTDLVDRTLNPYHAIQKQAASLAQKSYLYDFAAAVFNLNPNTLKPYSPGDQEDVLLGVPTTKAVKALVTNYLPLVRNLEQMLPASVVGSPATTSNVSGLQLLDSPGTPGWLGAVPSSGGSKSGIKGVGGLVRAISGLSVQEIDPARNVIRTYKDLEGTRRQLNSSRKALFAQMQQNRGGTPQQQAKFQQLKQLEIILLRNKMAIDSHAVATGKTPPLVFDSFQGKFDKLLAEPLKDDALQTLVQEYVGDAQPTESD